MPRCYVLGAGNLGTLAADYFADAGWDCIAAGRAALTRRLSNGVMQWQRTLAADDGAPIRLLVLATKVQDSAAALAPLRARLDHNSVLLRLQNGLLDPTTLGLPPLRRLEAISFSGAWRDTDADGVMHVHRVAENDTYLGDGSALPPPWFAGLQQFWPKLQWRTDIYWQQWRKLAVNAVLNPLTALYDCRNGELLAEPGRRAAMAALAAEVDALARRLFEHWPNDTLARSEQVAVATAGNLSSMCADRRAGRATEIDFINGALLRAAAQQHLSLPHHTEVVARLKWPLASVDPLPGTF